MTIKYDSETIGLMMLFENITKAKVKDCFVDNNKLQLFVVEQNELSKAIGKGGSKAKMLEKILNRRLRVIEYDPDVKQFVKNVVYPLQIAEVIQENDIITLIPSDSRVRGLLIGRAAQNLRNTESIVQRYFPIKELKVQ